MIELKRKFYDFLLHWKMDKKQECLLVKGARQIGKTYIIRKFGRENYDEFVEINFVLNPEYMSVFEGNLESEQIISRITAIRPDVRFEAGKTLLFLDEIQECPNARTALKPLATTSRCDVIASGSLLGIKYKKSQLRKVPRSIPVGYERQVTMHSLSFEEYLWAQGYGDEQFKYLRGFFERREKVPEAVKDGKVTDMSGDPEQIARMKKLDADNSPAGFTLDEVGLVTTDIADNDTHWTSGRFDNGTHAHNCIHIALGKNMSRKGVVHSNLHMDMDIRRPTVMLDGQVVMKDGIFVDSVWE